MRHGRPRIDEATPMPARDFPAWLEAYRKAPLADDSQPPPSSRQIAREADLIICSQLIRSIESAHRLDRADARVLEGFEEMAMPHSRLPLLKLTARGWATLFRLLWLAGYSRNAAESRRQGGERARLAADRLARLAREHGHVLFVGHGIFNRFLARQLRISGWQGPADPGRGHWSFASYRAGESVPGRRAEVRD